MTYEIEIEFHPLYELVSSMAVFTNPKPYYDLDKKWFQILESKVAFCVRWPRINGDSIFTSLDSDNTGIVITALFMKYLEWS